MSPAAGRTFGPYRLQRSIATDAVSTTWIATGHDGAAPGRQGAAQVAVRISGRIARDDTAAGELVQQYLADVQRAGAVDHPAIARPLDLGIIDGHPYVVSPFVRAVPLREMLARNGAIPAPTALAIFAQLAGGIDAAHRVDVVHGALSPNTIWIGPSGRRGASVGYLTGFGSSLLLRRRLSGEPRGDPIDDVLYVAPEQLRGEAVTRASDQYALACALYHALAGRPPFARESRAKLYGAHLMTAPPVLRQHDATIAESTSDALRRAMAKDQAARFASCGAMVNAALPTGEDLPTPPPRRSTPRASPPPRQRAVSTPPAPRAPWPWVLAGTVVVVGLLLWLLSAAAS